MTKAELTKECRKIGITARKFEGDDAYSWAVFQCGVPKITGLGRSEVDYWKRTFVAMHRRKNETNDQKH